jgi:hypothetical protein
MRHPMIRILLGAGLALSAGASNAGAQGAGSTASQLLQLTAGSRSAALAGAAASLSGDAESVFSNPAGTAGLAAGAAFSAQRHVEEITIGSLAGSARLGPVFLAAGISYLDAGSIQVVRPAPGGQRGDPTGQTASATESVARLAVALPMMGGRLRAGAAAGMAAMNLADESYNTAFFDVGAQVSPIPAASLGLVLRNLGGSMAGAPLPSQARLGASVRGRAGEMLGALVTADLVAGLEEETTGFAAGLEVGLIPPDRAALGAVVRLGWDASGPDGIAPLQAGVGVGLRGVTVDYALQSFEYFGLAHRIGVRWSRLR